MQAVALMRSHVNDQFLLGRRLHTWLGFQHFYSSMLLVPAVARPAARVCDQSLNRPPMQLTLRAAVSCIPTLWVHGASQNLYYRANRARALLVLQVVDDSSQIACSQVHVSTWVAECQ